MSTVVLPKQVQAQVDEAERIQQQLAGAAPDSGETPEDLSDPDVDQPAEPAVSAAPGVPSASAGDDWQKRYATLQGKFNAEVPKLHQAIRDRDAQINAFGQELVQLKAKVSEPKAKVDPLVTNQDDEKFGSDLIDLIRRAAREEGAAVVQRLDGLEGSMKSVLPEIRRVGVVANEVAQTRADRYWSEVDAAVPDWKEINANPKWLAWLGEYDPVAGRTRQAALDEASQNLEHQRVIAMFRLFEGPAPTTQRMTQARTELARQVAPSRSSKTTVQPQSEKVFTGMDYEYWCDPRRVHDTSAEQRAQMMAELERAIAEGRVRF